MRISALVCLSVLVTAACGGDDSGVTSASSSMGAGGAQQGSSGNGTSSGGSGGETSGTTATGGSAGDVGTGGGGGTSGADDAGMGGSLDGGTNVTPPGSGPFLDCGSAPKTDWGTAMVESTIKRNPDPLSWEYSRALFLHGAYLVYKRTKDPKILAYIKAWADARVGESTSNGYGSVDSMMPNTVLLDMYEETHDAKYGQGAARVRNRFRTYPRTSDGAFWHNTGAVDQTWGDGVFMGMPPLERYGHLFNDSAYTDDESSKQLLLYHDHLKNPNGLHWHAWAECRNDCPSWTTRDVHHSPESWGRANGWYAMATMMILDLLPANHPNRAPLITIMQGLVEGFKKWQDDTSGRWYQIVDKGTDLDNWLETSSSSMYTYTIAKSIRLGYVDASYAPVAVKGLQGILQKIALDGSGMTNLTDICRGTNVGDAAYYYARPRPVNDFHGLGSFLIMYEELHADCKYK